MTKAIRIHLSGPLIETPYGKTLQWTACGKPHNAVRHTLMLKDITCKVCRSSKLVPSWAWSEIDPRPDNKG